MNRISVPFVKSLLVATLALAGAASAQQPAAAKPDVAKGGTLFESGDAARGIPACVACHGAGGNSTIAANPKLAAQFEAYTYKQLVDFTTPSRNNAIMSPIAKQLSDQEKKDIAAYLAKQQPKPGAAHDKNTVELGRNIYRGGIAAKGVAACASCHGPIGAGVPIQYPRLAGQNQDYSFAQLQAFKSGARKNSPQMTTLAQRMSDEEMKAVVDYIAGLK
ncbi:c-type cytochrome [Massilia horti]|uniref:Cytochrome c4 n=1 Tax=Massilia horti TaxID=2562153 RepID=A0A4Y9SMH7_9BURK|nr:c-type cytochrome [Massilia horti]TFW27850.1 cytochrome c4 [Massilia horti]